MFFKFSDTLVHLLCWWQVDSFEYILVLLSICSTNRHIDMLIHNMLILFALFSDDLLPRHHKITLLLVLLWLLLDSHIDDQLLSSALYSRQIRIHRGKETQVSATVRTVHELLVICAVAIQLVQCGATCLRLATRHNCMLAKHIHSAVLSHSRHLQLVHVHRICLSAKTRINKTIMLTHTLIQLLAYLMSWEIVKKGGETLTWGVRAAGCLMRYCGEFNASWSGWPDEKSNCLSTKV